MLEKLLTDGVFECETGVVRLTGNGRFLEVSDKDGVVVMKKFCCWASFWEIEQFLGTE